MGTLFKGMEQEEERLIKARAFKERRFGVSVLRSGGGGRSECKGELIVT